MQGMSAALVLSLHLFCAAPSSPAEVTAPHEALQPLRAQSEADPASSHLHPERPQQRSWLIPTAHAGGLMAGMRLSLSLLWPESFNPLPLSRSFDTFRQNWSRAPHFETERALFESDNDPWPLNAIGHGLFGSEVYLRARQCGHAPLPALAFTTAASTFWEYGIEAFHKRPSAVDLVWTPLGGLLIGEVRYRVWRAADWTPLKVVVDPFGELERALGTRC